MAVSTVVSVVLEEADIPGASLDEPLDSHNMASLRWWLQCHGIKPITSWKKRANLKVRRSCCWLIPFQFNHTLKVTISEFHET